MTLHDGKFQFEYQVQFSSVAKSNMDLPRKLFSHHAIFRTIYFKRTLYFGMDFVLKLKMGQLDTDIEIKPYENKTSDFG